MRLQLSVMFFDSQSVAVTVRDTMLRWQGRGVAVGRLHCVQCAAGRCCAPLQSGQVAAAQLIGVLVVSVFAWLMGNVRGRFMATLLRLYTA